MKKRKKLGRRAATPKADSWASIRTWRDAAINQSGVHGPADRVAAGQVFDEYRRQCLPFETDTGAGVALILHAETDTHAEESKQRTAITCRKGCSACCYQAVEATPPEIVPLVRAIRSGEVTVDMRRLTLQSGLGAHQYARLPHEDRACVFLDAEGLCKVYDVRPVVCRKLAVVSEPEFCDVEKHPGHKVLIVKNVYPEVLHFAAGSVFGMDSMPGLLLTALNNGIA